MTWPLDSQQFKSGGKCLNVVGGATTNGTKSHLWDCGGWDRGAGKNAVTSRKRQ